MAHYPDYVRVCVQSRHRSFADEDFVIVGIVRREHVVRDVDYGEMHISLIEEHIGSFVSPGNKFRWSRQLAPIIHLHDHASRVMKIIRRAIAHVDHLRNIGVDANALKPGEELWGENV